MIKMISVLVLMALPALAVGANYDAIPETFFNKLKSGQPEAAIDYLYNTNSWASNNADQGVNLKSQLKGLEDLVGKYLFHELIVEQKVGSHYAHLIYLVGYERQPLRFEIKVYKAGDRWRFQGVSFDAELTDQVEKLANQRLVN